MTGSNPSFIESAFERDFEKAILSIQIKVILITMLIKNQCLAFRNLLDDCQDAASKIPCRAQKSINSGE